MTTKLLVVLALATGAGCTGGKGSAKCPDGIKGTPVAANDLEDPSFVDLYDVDQVCLSRADDAVTRAVAYAPGVLGTYQYDNFGTFGEPIVKLDASVGAGGASKWQDHGCEANDIEWGIEVTSDGKADVYESGDAGAKFRIWSKQLSDCTYKCEDGGFCDPAMVGMHVDLGRTNKWVIADYLVFAEIRKRSDDTNLGQIAIFGERWK